MNDREVSILDPRKCRHQIMLSEDCVECNKMIEAMTETYEPVFKSVPRERPIICPGCLGVVQTSVDPFVGCELIPFACPSCGANIAGPIPPANDRTLVDIVNEAVGLMDDARRPTPEQLRDLNERLRAATSTGESVCAEADRIVAGARRGEYGPPERNLADIAGMWNIIVGREPITPAKVALCMIALKIVRECHQHKRDNLVDMCGYARLIEMFDGGGER